MTITADQVFLPVEKHDVDHRPGSDDVTWAERAYHHDLSEPSKARRKSVGGGRRRLRTLAAALLFVVVMVGLVVLMRSQGSAPAQVAHQPASSQTVTAPRTTIAPSPFTLTTPPMISPLPSLTPTIDTPKR
jgi:hypothetical protein